MRSIVALIILPALVLSSSPGPVHLFGGCSNGWSADKEFDDENYLTTASGEYAITYRDPYGAESSTTCDTILLDFAGESYTYTYKDSSGNPQEITGYLGYSGGWFILSDMTKGFLGTDCGWFANKCTAHLIPAYADKNSMLLKSCTGWWFFATQTSYYLTSSTQTDANMCDTSNCAR